MKAFKVVTLVVMLVSVLWSPATAQITEPMITATAADTNSMTLLIEGFNLPKGAVFMGQAGGGAKKLNVTSSNSTAIEAQLLSAEPGTYIVAIALSADQFWTGYVTVGAVGPQGPQGDQGPQGPQGPPGPGCGENVPDLWICTECNLRGIRLNGENLRRAFLRGSDISYAQFGGADLTAANFSAVRMDQVNFTSAVLSGANFEDALGYANFNDAILIGAIFGFADLAPGVTPSEFTNADLTNATFASTNLGNVVGLDTANLIGVNWFDTICPDGTNSDVNGGTCEGHLVP